MDPQPLFKLPSSVNVDIPKVIRFKKHINQCIDSYVGNQYGNKQLAQFLSGMIQKSDELQNVFVCFPEDFLD